MSSRKKSTGISRGVQLDLEAHWSPTGVDQSAAPKAARASTPSVIAHSPAPVADPQGGGQISKQPEPACDKINRNDFHAYLPTHQYIFAPTRELWPSASVNARVSVPMEVGPDGKPLKPCQWLDAHRPVDQMLWAPGESMAGVNYFFR